MVGQGETVVVWDADTKRPLHNAVVLAGQQDARRDRTAARQRRGKPDARAGGTASRPLFLGRETALADRPRGRRPPASFHGAASARHERRVLARQPDRRIRHRCLDSLADEPDEFADSGLGPGVLRGIWGANRMPAGDPILGRRFWRSALERRTRAREHSRPAGGAVSARVPQSWRHQDHLWHRGLRAGSDRTRAPHGPNERTGAALRMAQGGRSRLLRRRWRPADGGLGRRLAAFSRSERRPRGRGFNRR